MFWLKFRCSSSTKYLGYSLLRGKSLRIDMTVFIIKSFADESVQFLMEVRSCWTMFRILLAEMTGSLVSVLLFFCDLGVRC